MVLSTTPTTRFAVFAIASSTACGSRLPAGARRSSLWNSGPCISAGKRDFSVACVPARSPPVSSDVREYAVTDGSTDNATARRPVSPGTSSVQPRSRTFWVSSVATRRLMPSSTTSSTGAFA